MKQGNQSTKNIWLRALISGPTLALCVACSSAPKASIDQNSDQSAVADQISADIHAAYEKQYDVIDATDISNAEEKLAKAKSQINDKADKSKIVNTLAEARGLLDRGKTKSGELVPRMTGILDSRQAALKAGTRDVDATGLKSADDKVRSEVDKIQTRTLSPDKWSSLQANYLKLEIEALQASNLNDAINKINGAVKAGASNYAPRLLTQASWAVKDSKNTIATQTHNPSAYQPKVSHANALAQLLTEVVAATDNGKVPEAAAQKIVVDKHKIGQLQTAVGVASGQIAAQDAKIRDQNGQISLDLALASAQKEFSKKEAEVYRQGDKLLLRLKGIDFAVGQTSLPKNSMALLNKVKKITMDLEPQAVVVEGNTDATGSADMNRTLSQGRAESVAKFLATDGVNSEKIKSVGNGFDRPLASNKTASGRAKNRRVDITITPSVQAQSISE